MTKDEHITKLAEYFAEICLEKAVENWLQYGPYQPLPKPRNEELDRAVYGPSVVSAILARQKLLDAHRENMLRHIPKPWWD